MTKYRKRYKSKRLSSQHQPFVSSMKADMQFVLSEFSLSHSVSIFIQRTYLDCTKTILLVIKRKRGKTRSFISCTLCVTLSSYYAFYYFTHNSCAVSLMSADTCKNHDFSIIAWICPSHSTISLLL